jgi:hypothetical protein
MKSGQEASFETICLPKFKATKGLFHLIEEGKLNHHQFTYLENTYQEYVNTLKSLLSVENDLSCRKIAFPYLMRGIELTLKSRLSKSAVPDKSKSYLLNICNASKKKLLRCQM